MGFDIDQHTLIPEHEVLSEDEAAALLDQFDITIEQLPVIDRKDAMVKHLEAEIGDVIRITRESTVAGETEYYRRVVEV